jgi:hypothetical protein
VGELGAPILDGNHSIAPLAGKNQLLNQSWCDSASEGLLQAEQFETTRDIRNTLSSILVRGRTTIQELKNQIQSLIMNLRKDSIERAEKVPDVIRQNGQMDHLVTVFLIPRLTSDKNCSLCFPQRQGIH